MGRQGRTDLSACRDRQAPVNRASRRTTGATVKALAPGLVLLNQDAVLEETYDGEDISGRYRVTTVWARRDGRWRLLFEQEVPLSDLSEAGKP